MLRHHQIFKTSHFGLDPDFDGDPKAREKYRRHPHFEWTATFVDTFDQNTLQANYDTAPIEVFLPMVHRVFAQEPHAVQVID